MEAAPHSALMDSIYRNQRHIYDLTRRYYLLGRDHLIAELSPPAKGTVLEIGCGTGRNLIAALRHHSAADYFGMDISNEMLETAAASAARAGVADRIRFAQGDATCFDPQSAFGIETFDRVFMSYTISMIPVWKDAIADAMRHVKPGGSLHLVDFGQQERLPGWFRGLLFKWLDLFHVTPRADMRDVLAAEAERSGATLQFQSLYRGYAWYGVITMPGAEA
ncbi:MAG: methyltransferase domain-containing protein [Rhizobiales bacterium]|nr:methyltransferase domain-containing protein [Hyphomicrobiales bacterium]